jgi:hypothetical protein
MDGPPRFRALTPATPTITPHDRRKTPVTYTPAAAQADTLGIWNYRLTQKGRPTVPIRWTETTAADGSPLLSGWIDSPTAEEALLRFVREGSLGLAYEAGPCQQPTLDDSVPGRHGVRVAHRRGVGGAVAPRHHTRTHPGRHAGPRARVPARRPAP